MLLVSGATATVRQYAGHQHLGQLVTPDIGNAVSAITDTGMLWAADNACYTGLRPARYLRLLDRIAQSDTSRLLWVTVPDVVGDAEATLAFWKAWRPELADRNLPAAFVAQDGITRERIPWDELDALFIGGSTGWKLSAIPLRLALWAKHLGKWVHWGRANSNQREDWIDALDGTADSFDGSKYSMFPDTWIPPALKRLEQPRQMGMKGVMLYASG